MDLLIYLNKNVYISLRDGYYYKGKVISADENSLTLIDFKGQKITLTSDCILRIQEVGDATN